MAKGYWKKKIGAAALVASMLLVPTITTEAASVESEEAVDAIVQGIFDKSKEVTFTDVGIFEIMSYYATAVEGADLTFTKRGVELSLDLDAVDTFYKENTDAAKLLGKNFSKHVASLKKDYSSKLVFVFVEDFKFEKNKVRSYIEQYVDEKGKLISVDKYYLDEKFKIGKKPYVPNEEDYVPDKEPEISDNSKTPTSPTDKPTSGATKFKDIQGHFAYDAIVNLHDAGIVNGTTGTTYSPQNPITRGQFAAMVSRTLETEMHEFSKTNKFQDINGHWAKNEILFLYDLGIINGTTTTTFSPDKYITRQQAVSILERYLKYKGIAIKSDFDYASQFKDKEKIANYAKDAVSYFYSVGVISGKTGNVFDPLGNLTRGQMAKILWGTLELE